MTTVNLLKVEMSVPDMDSLMNSIKTINRSVPATSDCAYSYFADSVKMSSTIADNIDLGITDALTTLPIVLEKLTSVDEFAKNIAKINAAAAAGAITAEAAGVARAQLLEKLNDGLSTVITSFESKANDLSNSAERLSKYSATVEVRIKDAYSTETANLNRAKSDVERESARVSTLQARYEKLKDAVDEKRGGPLDELISIIPDEKELSGLLDVGAADAAAPEVAAAKKAIELAVAQLKKVLEAIGGTVEFMQLVEMRDEVFKALQEQRKVSYAAAERLKAANKTIGELETIKSAGSAMNTVAVEANKIVSSFSAFVDSLKKLDGKEITENTITALYDAMKSYLDQVREAKNNVILS